MKNFTFALAVALTTALCSSAASFDEEQLLGYWKVTQIDGPISPSVETFTGIYFGDVWVKDYESFSGGHSSAEVWDGNLLSRDVFEGGPEYGGVGVGYIENIEDTYADHRDEIVQMILTFSITNDNKLHLLRDYGFWQFKIEELTDNSMQLVTYTSKYPRRITLEKADSSVASVAADSNAEDGVAYDLNGRPAAHAEKGVIVKSVNGKYRKIIRR